MNCFLRAALWNPLSGLQRVSKYPPHNSWWLQYNFKWAPTLRLGQTAYWEIWLIFLLLLLSGDSFFPALLRLALQNPARALNPVCQSPSCKPIAAHCPCWIPEGTSLAILGKKNFRSQEHWQALSISNSAPSLISCQSLILDGRKVKTSLSTRR